MQSFSAGPRFRGLGLLFLLALPPALPGAPVYRCVDAGGRVEFRQTACPGGAGGRLSVEVPEIGWVLPPKQRQKAAVRSRPSRVTPATARGTQRSQARQRRCWERQQRLQRLQRRLRRGYKASEGERLRRQRDEQEAWLRRFCKA